MNNIIILLRKNRNKSYITVYNRVLLITSNISNIIIIIIIIIYSSENSVTPT